jgi:hypothetical protein
MAIPHMSGWTYIKPRIRATGDNIPLAGTVIENQGSLTINWFIGFAVPYTASWDFVTKDETAKAGTDYGFLRGTVTCPPNQTACSSTTNPILDDGRQDEANIPVTFLFHITACHGICNCAGCAPLDTRVAIDEVPYRVVQGPDIKVVNYIAHDLTYSSCIAQLASLPPVSPPPPPYGKESACWALSNSANRYPPLFFEPYGGVAVGQGSWVQFQQSREYRGYIHLSPLRLACDPQGNAVAFSQTASDEYSYGFTKEPANFVFPFFFGDVWNATNFNGASISSDAISVTATDQRASRLDEADRQKALLLLGYDAPFIYATVTNRVSCSTTPPTSSVAVQRSIFPTTALYINDSVLSEAVQKDLEGFVQSGGTDYHLPGTGNFAPQGTGLKYSE